MQVENSCCGLLCQHPSCWSAQRRRARAPAKQARPKQTIRHQPSHEEDEEDGLPTQTVVNLLESFDDDPHMNKASFARATRSASPHHYLASSGYQRTTTDGLPYQTSLGGESSYARIRAPHGTPASRQLSSVHPSSASHPVAQTGFDCSTPAHISKPPGQISQCVVQEVVELEDLQKEKEHSAANQYYVWIPRAKRTLHSAKMKRENTGSGHPRDMTEDMMPMDVEWQRKAMKMFDEVWPVLKCKLQNRSPYAQEKGGPKASRQSARHPFQGIYELLDLPREVLSVLLQHVNERDMLDRQRFAEALMHTLPRLERQSKSLALAHSRVLRQRKMRITQSDQSHDYPRHSLSPKQLYLVEDPLYDPLANLQPPGLLPPYPESPEARSPCPGRMATRPLVPGIRPADKKSAKAEEGRIAAISLGLPEIPSGVKHTRPFVYKNKDLDFTLGPVEPPQIVSSRKAESISGSEHSTLHVTVPSVPSEPEQDVERDELTRQDTEDEVSQHPPLHMVSPSQSTHVPRVPYGTPATRQSTNFAPLEGATPQRLIQEDSFSPGGPEPVSAEPTGILGTIPESETDNTRASRGLAKSRRSVRFASDVPLPPQPPSSPESGVSPSRPVGSLEAASLGVVCPSHDSDRQKDKSPVDLKIMNGYNPPSPVPSPEPWPEVNEDDYNISPTPPPGRATGSSSLKDIDHSNVANYHDYDMRSEQSGSASIRQTGPSSRESSRHSTKRQLLHSMGESPAPPPPSPEPKDMTSGDPETTDSAMVNILQDFVETESEITLSAKPPSNLDDLSRINTPINTPVQVEIGTTDSTTFDSILHLPQRNGSGSKPSTPGMQSESSRPSTKGNPDMGTVKECADEEEAEAGENNNNNNEEHDLPNNHNESNVVTCTEGKSTVADENNSSAQPLQASHLLTGQGIDNEAPVADRDIEQGIAQLEQFDTSEDNLKDELKEEYDRLEREDFAQ